MEIPFLNSEVKKLRKNDKELTEQLLATEGEYEKVYKVAEDWLRHIYMTCKGQFVLWRYGHIKEMMKECIDFLNHPEQYGRPPIPSSVETESKTKFEYKDIEQMKTKEEIEDDIKRKVVRKEKLDDKIKRLKALGMNYENSKQYYPYRRYDVLRSIIKEIIRN